MAKTPSESARDHSGSVQNGEMRHSALSLTGSAGRYADKHQLRDELTALRLGPECLPGDTVSLETAGRPHDFMILCRRWVVTSTGRQLEFTLDHPARSARS